MSGAWVTRLDLGPADGMAVAVKDTIDIAGCPTRAGSAALGDAPAARAHAEVVSDDYEDSPYHSW